MKAQTLALMIAMLLALPARAGDLRLSLGTACADEIAVTPTMVYSRQRGFGFESQGNGQVRYFSVDLPEGNYRVSIRFGSSTTASDNTVKSELRRLALQDARTAPGESVERSFIVNVRNARIQALNGIAAGAVELKVPRETVEEAWAWDGRLSLELNGSAPAVQRIAISPAAVPTIFLLGDSTVADQSQEPYASWGQILPRFFTPNVAVANHAESGESYRDSIARRRLDKVASQLQPGDTVLLQFGHNDQKQKKDGSGDARSYQAEIRSHVEAIRARAGLPVIVSSMERRGFDEQGRIRPSLIEYADAARQVAEAMKVPFIDLNSQSKRFYEALGPERSKLAFASPAPGKIDNTHHNSYGAYQLARLVAAGLRDLKLPVAALLDEAALGSVDAAKPLPAPEDFVLAPSPNFSHQRPLGDEDPP
jgi:lysophospholipase L1-like esterase